MRKSTINYFSKRIIIGLFLFAVICVNTNAQSDTTWRISTPEEQGMSSAILQKMKQHVISYIPSIKGVMIIRNKHIVYEEYRNTSYTNQLNKIYSCTKSFSSALIGIAINKGFIKDTNERLVNLLPEYSNILSQNGKDSIRLKHLLTMTSGFQWDESTYSYNDSRNTHSNMVNSADWFKYVLERPLISIPGETFTYNTGTSNLFAKILQNATHIPYDSFAIKYLFEPLHITNYNWYRIAQDNNIPSSGGSLGGLYLSTHDMAKMGYLYLHNGMWDTIQVVPKEWVEKSITPQSDLWPGGGYGFQWWMMEVGGYNSFQAIGYGGQFIIVIPELDIIAVIISDDNTEHTQNSYIVADFVVPSATNKNAEYCECDFSSSKNYVNVSTDTYVDLTDATSINKGLTWDDPNYRIPIGFNFQQCDKTTDSLCIFAGNSISVGSVTNTINPEFIPFGADLVDRASNRNNFQGQSGSLSPISYKFEGSDGDRILKIEWKNVGFFGDIYTNNTSTDYVNFQLWLYESDSTIEVRYGPNSVTNPSVSYNNNTGPYIGFAFNSRSAWFLKGIWLRGNTTVPSYITNSQNPLYLNGTPANGTVYKFSKELLTGLSPKPRLVQKFQIYPNPTTGLATLSFGSLVQLTNIEIYNLQGTQVLSKTFQNSTSATIDLTGLTAGIYMVKVIAGEKYYKEKILKE
jgi:CubicO group peptidase (beta-lactamase class C family)